MIHVTERTTTCIIMRVNDNQNKWVKEKEELFKGLKCLKRVM